MFLVYLDDVNVCILALYNTPSCQWLPIHVNVCSFSF